MINFWILSWGVEIASSAYGDISLKTPFFAVKIRTLVFCESTVLRVQGTLKTLVECNQLFRKHK